MLQEAFGERLEGSGLTRLQWIALYTLLEEGPINQKRMAEELGVANSSVGRLIDRLEKSGLVERTVDQEDRRSFVVTLSTEGRDRIHKLLSVGERFHEDLLQGISQDDLSTYERVLETMMSNVVRE